MKTSAKKEPIQTDTENQLLTHALRYAELGYPVFPCLPNGKIPLTKHGLNDATTDAEQIEKWWKENPSANIGLVTQGLFVVDIDGSDNYWPHDANKELELSAGITSTTPRGGRHHIFRQPEGGELRNTTGKIADRVDTRANGGYIVAAPSVIGGKSYCWDEGSELCERSQLTEPPAWIVSSLNDSITGGNLATTIIQESNPIPDGQRNDTLARLAGAMRQKGFEKEAINAAIQQTNKLRCNPPLPPSEVEKIAQSIGRYPPDQISVATIENHWGQDAANGDSTLEFDRLTSRELFEGDFQLDYLIDGLLVKGQPGGIFGPKKTLKTNISIDLAISLGTGTDFLGEFPVKEPIAVGIMSGESGEATIKETALRIASARGLQLADCKNVFWSFELPQLHLGDHVAALEKFVIRDGLQAIILDPAYLMLMLGDAAGNLFEVGKMLKPLGDITSSTGCTLLLCHHLRKNVKPDSTDAPELEDIAWSGFQEFCRQWFLLGRREKYNPDIGGSHNLWFSYGGSAGHSGAYGLDIEEGTRQDDGGRRWEVNILSAHEARRHAIDAKQAAKAQSGAINKEARQKENRDAVLDVLEGFPDGATITEIREATGKGSGTIKPALHQLEKNGEVEKEKVQRGNRPCDVFRLSDFGPSVRPKSPSGRTDEQVGGASVRPPLGGADAPDLPVPVSGNEKPDDSGKTVVGDYCI